MSSREQEKLQMIKELVQNFRNGPQESQHYEYFVEDIETALADVILLDLTDDV